jgi:hypothetical protein
LKGMQVSENRRVIDLLGRLREQTGLRAKAESELCLALEQVDAARCATEEILRERSEEDAQREKEAATLLRGVAGDCPPDEWRQRYLTVVAQTRRYNAGLVQDLATARNYGAQMEAQFARLYLVLQHAVDTRSALICQQIVREGFAPIKSSLPVQRAETSEAAAADEEAGNATTLAEAAAHWKNLWEKACEERDEALAKAVLWNEASARVTVERGKGRDLVVEVILHFREFGMRPAWEDRPGNEWLKDRLTEKLKEHKQ